MQNLMIKSERNVNAMKLFDPKRNKDENGFSSYFKRNGDIEVHVAKDGTEIFQVPIDYKWVGTEEEDGVSCPNCAFEEIYYHNGEYICVNCESTFSEHELEDYCGCRIIHG
jgi:DNA-directed RNA polymerase subunit RPC12/RpoP